MRPRPRVTCFNCRSVFTDGSGPAITSNDLERSILYYCPGCRHGTTLHEWITLNIEEDEGKWLENIDRKCNELAGE